MTFADGLVSLLKFAVGAGILGYVGRGLFSQYLSRDLERFKTQLSALHFAEVERLKADLRAAAFEHETRFARLHERRVEIVAELYKRLAITDDAFADILSPIQFGGSEDRKQRIKQAGEYANDFFKYFNHNRIFLDEQLCELIAALWTKFRIAWSKFAGDPTREFPSAKEWNEAWEAFTSDVPPLRQEIEKRVRQMLGVSNKTSALARPPST